MRLAVLGSPISHSKSPAIQSAALEYLGYDSVIQIFDVSSDLNGWIEVNGPNWNAFAVTMPLKEEAYALAESTDHPSKATGGTNFLLRTSTGYSGFNTDVMGIQKATESFSFDTVGVIGTGATARSALYAMSGRRTLVWGRDTSKAESLASRFGAESSSLETVAKSDLVISTLPKGALAKVLRGKYPGVILDAVYAQPFSESFDRHISGIEMLIWQAVGQLRLMVNDGAVFADEQTLHDLMLRAAKVGE